MTKHRISSPEEAAAFAEELRKRFELTARGRGETVAVQVILPKEMVDLAGWLGRQRAIKEGIQNLHPPGTWIDRAYAESYVATVMWERFQNEIDGLAEGSHPVLEP